MDMKSPKNIVEWTLPRSGSTHFLQRMSRALALTYNDPDTKNMQEGTGLGGIFRDYLGITKEIDFGDIFSEDPVKETINCDYMQWYIDETGKMRIHTVHGDPLMEPVARARMLKTMTWRNPVVIKNMRWSSESSETARLNDMFDRAVIDSEVEKFYHVVLWRRDAFELMCSRLIMTMIHKAHGTYEWDGKRLFGIVDPNMKELFQDNMFRLFSTFKDSLSILPPEQTVMVETKRMNDLHLLEWSDGTELYLPPPDSLLKPIGSSNYVNIQTGEKVKPAQMLGPRTLDLIRQIAVRVEKELGWSQLDKTSGLKIL